MNPIGRQRVTYSVKVRHQVKYHCLHCGKPTERGRKGEHIIPEVIGGAVTLNEVSSRAVCRDCNSGVLSQLDRELCSRSYLSAIASRELGYNLWQTWDVDHSSNHLLLEARPAWAADKSLQALVCFPQITFEKTGPAVHGDSEEFSHFGEKEAVKVLFQAARRCFRQYRAGVKGVLHFERVRSGVIRDGYRLPPRIYAPHPIGAIAKNIRKQSFVLRFTNPKDMDFAIHSMSNQSDSIPMKKWAQRRGSHSPTICFYFDAGMAVRALMKIGLNLLATYCPNTPVDHESFAAAVRIIRGEMQITPRGLKANGFVRSEGIQPLAAAKNAHSFRLVHIDGAWCFYASFFGGQVGARVHIPGPNHEQWRWAEIVAPLASKEWSVERGSILRPMKVQVEWENGQAVIPSIEFQRTVTSINVESHKRRTSGTNGT